MINITPPPESLNFIQIADNHYRESLLRHLEQHHHLFAVRECEMCGRVGQGCVEGVCAFIVPTTPAVTLEIAFELAQQIVPMVVSQFYPSNRSLYVRCGWVEIDIEQYLYHHVWMERYADLVVRCPQYYPTIDNFKKSFYIACKNRCLQHYRTHIKSQGRGNILRMGVLELDNNVKDGRLQGDAIALADTSSGDFMHRGKQMIDGCHHDPMVERMVLLFVYDRYDSRATLRARMRWVPDDVFDGAFDRMQSYIEQWREEMLDAVHQDQTIWVSGHHHGESMPLDLYDLEHDEAVARRELKKQEEAAANN
jgi:hypothetical protein